MPKKDIVYRKSGSSTFSTDGKIVDFPAWMQIEGEGPTEVREALVDDDITLTMPQALNMTAAILGPWDKLDEFNPKQPLFFQVDDPVELRKGPLDLDNRRVCDAVELERCLIALCKQMNTANGQVCAGVAFKAGMVYQRLLLRSGEELARRGAKHKHRTKAGGKKRNATYQDKRRDYQPYLDRLLKKGKSFLQAKKDTAKHFEVSVRTIERHCTRSK